MYMYQDQYFPDADQAQLEENRLHAGECASTDFS